MNNSNIYDQFKKWYKNDYIRSLWEDKNYIKLMKYNLEEKNKIFNSEYKEPSKNKIYKLINSSLWGYFIDDIGNPSYIDGI